MKLSDRILNRLKVRSEGLLEQEEIRRIRKKLHLSQEAAGFLIGGGPRAFQKYESGDLLPSRAVCNLLTVLDRVPDALKIIQEKIEQKGLQPFLEEYNHHNHSKNASTSSTSLLG
jgi:HTH-type transcriptional regulator/antitoxin MqsA